MEVQPKRRLRTFVLAVCAVSLASSCVSKAKHEEALANAKFYQRSKQDLESYIGTLEAENERLRGELALRDSEPLEAGMTRDIDARIQELDRIMSGMGSGQGDVTVLAVEGGYGLRMSDAILFDSGSAELKPEGRALLLEMAEEIRTRPFAKLWVRGHTDSDPIVRPATKERFPNGNLELSAARAVQVAALLGSEGGIPTEKLVIAGFGPAEPVAPNTADEKEKNRRVELFVIDESEQGG